MTLTPDGGAALPVSVTTTRKVQGGAAIPVYGYMTAPTDGRPAMGGSAIPVRVLTAADLKVNGGQWTVEGRPYAMPVYTAPATTTVQGGPAIAVYPVNAWPTVTPAPVVPSTLLDNLVAYWKLEEASGTRADATGRGNDLTPSGVPPPGNAAGRIGNAADFLDWGYLSKTDTADLSTGEVDFTFAGWHYYASGAPRVIACKSHSTTATLREWTLVNHDTGGFSFVVWNTAGGVQTIEVNGSAVPAYNRAGLLIPNVWHFIACGLNTTTGKIWIRAGSYFNSANKTITISDTAAPFAIGSYTDGAYYLIGRVDEAGFWKKVLTNAEQVELLNGGAGLTYPFDPAADAGAGIVLCHGDSLTHGNTVAYVDSYPAKLSVLQNRNAACNMGQSGISVATMVTDAPTYIDPVYLAGAKNVVVLWGGTNDLGASDSAATVWGRIKTYCAARKAVGFRTIVLTITARADAGWTAPMETQRGLLNASINGGDSSIDAVADVAALPNLADPNNATYFQADLVHLTATGFDEVAGLVNTTLNGI